MCFKIVSDPAKGNYIGFENISYNVASNITVDMLRHHMNVDVIDIIGWTDVHVTGEGLRFTSRLNLIQKTDDSYEELVKICEEILRN